ncbi:MAG: AMP-binding protein, partial [bacterium]
MSNIIQRLFDKNHVSSAIWRFPNEDISVTVFELGQRVRKYVKVLKDNQIGEGDRIGFILDNSYDLVCLLYATWYLNAVAVPLRPRSGRYHDYQKYLKNCDEICGFKLVIFEGESISEELACWATECKKSVASIREIAKTADGSQSIDGLEAVIVSPQDIAIIQFSSGSTGDPKGVVVTHGMMMAQLQNSEDNHARSRGRKVASSASWLPINHDMGLFIGVLSPIYSACDNLLSTPGYYMKNPSRWFGLLSGYKVDFTFSTNSVLASSLNSLRRLRKSSGEQSDKQPAVDLSNLHLYIAAEKVSPVIVRRTWDSLSEFNCPKENIHVGYGMAENTLGATYTTSGPIKMHWFVLNEDDSLSLSWNGHTNAFELASIGVPNDHHIITVRDRRDAILPELSLGELSIESPCVSPAYYNDPKITAKRLSNGRLRTGDLGFQYNGEFYFYSRADDLIIVGGRNIVPDDIETT